MTDAGRAMAREKMQEAGVSGAAIEVFSSYYEQLRSGATGLIRETDIEPLREVDQLETGPAVGEADPAALGRTVLIRLNGGLGTSMGMDRAKSLLPVRDGQSFLDLTVAQVLAARKRYGARLPLVFMNSFSTQEDTLAALAAYPTLPVADLPLDFLQSKEPKLRRDTLLPVEWPADPELEWCPPGHGDLYPSLLASGLLDQLIAAGFTQANVANSDNLGAGPSAEIAAWFEDSGAPYAAEVCTRTEMDRKGGHLARRRSDGRLVLRDTAQTAEEDMRFFTDEDVHPYFHTNNLWFNLEALREHLRRTGGVMGLPLIRNEKTVDPRDSSSTPVIQIESAMGAAIEVFEGATAICVG
nr:UTP--glucose-1-phosphate uridylyltransferase [Actinomycetales bacterium]